MLILCLSGRKSDASAYKNEWVPEVNVDDLSSLVLVSPCSRPPRHAGFLILLYSCQRAALPNTERDKTMGRGGSWLFGLQCSLPGFLGAECGARARGSLILAVGLDSSLRGNMLQSQQRKGKP